MGATFPVIGRRTLLGTAAAAACLRQTQAGPPVPAEHTIRITRALVELAPDRIISTNTYGGIFPGALLRFTEGRQTVVDIFNDTDSPEQLHWHGQFVSDMVDGAAEEGTPMIPAHGMRRQVFTPGPAGLRFYHSHTRAGSDLSAGQYSGQVGAVYIEPKREPGAYDREVFLVLKEFMPSFSLGGDMSSDFLAVSSENKALHDQGESAMAASLARGMPHGYEVGYEAFSINGRSLGHGDPIRVRQGERVLFHVLNGSATEIRSLALPGHEFQVVALDGYLVPTLATVPVLWIGTAERVSAIVDMRNPGVWVLGDLADDDRGRGMGVVVEYAGQSGKPVWNAPPPFKWDYRLFGKPSGEIAKPDEVIDMVFVKDNAADGGFNRWSINGRAYPDTMAMTRPAKLLRRGARYRIRMRNASDDIHPIHLHRHSFQLTKFAGSATSGVRKDVFMLGGYQEAEIDFVADNPGLTLFHCHQQLHMDYGFMVLFGYV